MKKIYIIRKYILAEDIHEAISQEASTPIHECYLDEDAVKDLKFTLTGEKKESTVGFDGTLKPLQSN
jgi:hypothetical protein